MSDLLLRNIDRRNQERVSGKTSGIVTGLVVQGGGMRGVYSMAALWGLEEMGYSHAFDHVVGSSAGAINGAYMLADQSELAVTVYTDDISNKHFINLWRLHNKIVDIDFLFHILTKVKPLNVKKVLSSNSTLHIALADYKTGKAKYLTNRDLDIDLMKALHAGAALPVAYNRPVKVGEIQYVDPVAIDPLPFYHAIELGCTDIVVVMTRPYGFRAKDPNFLGKLLLWPFLFSYTPEFRRTYFHCKQHFNKAAECIEKIVSEGDGVRVGVICPESSKLLARTTTRDRSILMRSALAGRNDARRCFGMTPLPPTDALFCREDESC